MTRASGNSSRIAIVASTPPMTGMRKSMSVMSGLCSRNNSIASRPFAITAKSVVCAHPQIAFAVLCDYPDQIARQTVDLRITGECSVPIATQPAAASADPKIAVAVCENASGPIVDGEPLRTRVRGEMTVRVERAQRRRVGGADPDGSGAVLANGQDEITGQAIFDSVVGEFAGPISTQAATLRSNPEGPVTA